jgi:hypothetical protein
MARPMMSTCVDASNTGDDLFLTEGDLYEEVGDGGSVVYVKSGSGHISWWGRYRFAPADGDVAVGEEWMEASDEGPKEADGRVR